MYSNLRNALESKGIKLVAVSQLIGCTDKSLQNKLKGRTDFSVKEAMLIKNNLLPEYAYEHLFASK